MMQNHKTELPQHHVAFDCESTPEPARSGSGACVHKLYLGRAVYWRYVDGKITRERWCSFRKPREFWDWLYSLVGSHWSLWCWAHNLGFDLSCVQVWEEIECQRLLLSQNCGSSEAEATTTVTKRPWRGSLCSEDPPTYLHTRTASGRTIKCCDTLNWCMTPLAEIARALKLPKLDMPGESADELDWLAYCTRDVVIVQRLVCKLLDTVRRRDLGCLRFTAASQAMQLFKHLPGAHKIVTDNETDHKKLERACYHAPRTEVYFAGACCAYDRNGLESFMGIKDTTPVLTRGPVYRLDLNAAYPSVMRDNFYPVVYLNTVQDITPDGLLRKLAAGAACADVTVDSGCNAWPRRSEGRTVWCRGRFRAQLCGPELLRALLSRDVVTVHKAQLYAQDRPFKRYCEHVLAWRAEARASADKIECGLAKLIANALHGKFAQRAHRWELVPEKVAPLPWGVYYQRDGESGPVSTWRAVGWNAQVKSEGNEADSNFPLIAAYVVAYHRERMRELVTAAGLRDVLYEDADSLHVTKPGFDALKARNLIDEHEPGKLRVVDITDVAIYHGLKNYTFGGAHVSTGHSSKAVRDAEGLWHQTDFLGVDALLSSGKPQGPISLEVTKKEALPAVNGRINADGWIDPPVYRG